MADFSPSPPPVITPPPWPDPPPLFEFGPAWSPPPSSRWRFFLALTCLFALVFVLAAAITEYQLNRAGTISTTGLTGKVEPALVDVNVVLANGYAEGTGMILSSNGIILTNNHVISGATSITVTIGGTGNPVPARLLGYSPTQDVAVLQAEGVSHLPTVALANSDSLHIGDQVTAIGNAGGKGGFPSPSTGVVVNLNQIITATDAGGGNPETLFHMVQVEANIQPGDSGGPLLNQSGSVVAMTTAGSTQTNASQGATQGFAIPINTARLLAVQIEAGHASNTVQIGARGILGVEIATSSAPPGASVVGITYQSPAAAAGIQIGDTITAVNATPINSASDLDTALTPNHPGQAEVVTWVDATGDSYSATIALIAGPPD